MTGWEPSTEAEAAMLAAVHSGDSAAWLRALASAPLLLPVTEEAAEGHEPARWATARHDGVTHVLAFTSPAAIEVGLPGQTVRYTSFSLPDIADNWPDRSWRLIVDMGLPIATLLTGDELAELPDIEVPGELELLQALIAGDGNAFTAALIRSELFVPVRPDGPPTRDPADPDFPWLVLPGPSVAVFTSEQRLRQALGECDFVVLNSLQLTSQWPDGSWALALNPGTPLRSAKTGAEMTELAAFLGGFRAAVNEAYGAERERQIAIAAAAEEAAIARASAQVQALPAGAKSDDEPYEPDPTAPVRLQLVIPPMYVSAYLEQGYDRAAGLVHTWYGPGRDTPQRLYKRLDLIGEGSPFNVTDEWVVVLRWEPNEQTPPAWAEGDPRMESLVVAHGTGLHRLAADGTDTLVAVFDAAEKMWAVPEV